MTRKDRFLEVHYIYPNGELSKLHLTPPQGNNPEEEYIKDQFMDNDLCRCKILYYLNVYLITIKKRK